MPAGLPITAVASFSATIWPCRLQITGETMRDLRKFLVLSWLWSLTVGACSAKQVGEALDDMGDVGTTDPNGFKLMLFCIALLFVVAGTLIGVTCWYFLKGKKKS